MPRRIRAARGLPVSGPDGPSVLLPVTGSPALPLPDIDKRLPVYRGESVDHWDGSVAPGARGGGAILGWLQAGWVQVLLCLAVAVPLFWPQTLALTDLGGHLGRFAVQIDGGKSADLARWYSFQWTAIPNLGTDLLMQLLAPHMGLEPALKAIVIAIVVIQAGGFLALARVVHGHVPPTALLALPLVYGYPFQYGFLNYTLCTALGSWALALWIRLDKAALRATRWCAFVPIAGTLWICHLEGWAVFCILAGGCELARWRAQEPALGWRAALVQAARPLSCLVVPCLLFACSPRSGGTSTAETGVWFDVIGKLGMIVMAMRDRWGVWDVASALALIGVIGWTWRSRGFERHAGLSLGAVIVGAAFALLPKHIGGTSFVDMRLVPMIMATALIAVRPRENTPSRVIELLVVAGLVFMGARMAGNAISMAIFDREFAQDLSVLESVPRDTLLVTVNVKPCLDYDPWLHDRRPHLAGYALARRHDFANDQWAMAGGQLLRVHAPAMGRFIGDPSQTSTPETCRGRPGINTVVETIPSGVSYLWILENGVARDFAGWHPVRLSPGSVLYSRD